jgi:hypothetical protein
MFFHVAKESYLVQWKRSLHLSVSSCDVLCFMDTLFLQVAHSEKEGKNRHGCPIAKWVGCLYLKYYLTEHEQQCFIRYKDTRRSRVSLGLIKHALRMF